MQEGNSAIRAKQNHVCVHHAHQPNTTRLCAKYCMTTLSVPEPVWFQAAPHTELLYSEVIVEIDVLLSQAAAVAEKRMLGLATIQPQMPQAVLGALGFDGLKCRLVHSWQ